MSYMSGASFSSSSNVRMPAMPLPTTTNLGFFIVLLRADGVSSSACSRSDARGADSRPFVAPLVLDAGQETPRQQRDTGEQPQAQRVAAGVLLHHPHARRQQEATDAAGHADQSGHQADGGTEAL